MATQVDQMPPPSSVAEILKQGLADMGFSQMDGWALYRMSGGRIKASAFLHYLQGQSEPKVTDYNLIAQVFNDELARQGKEPWLPLVFRVAPGGEGTAHPEWVARESNPEPTDLQSVA